MLAVRFEVTACRGVSLSPLRPTPLEYSVLDAGGNGNENPYWSGLFRVAI
jgi:hypothetical protein